MKNQYLSIILLLVALLSCSKKDTLFKEISPKTSNIIFENKLNQTEEFNLIEYLYFYNGGGVAVGDVNNDGLNDIYLSANQEENKLYLNKGNFIFEDITAKANLSSPGGWKTGVVMIDINGDGYLDIYQNRLGGYKNINGKNQLYINNRDLTFTEVAQDYGLDFEGFSTHSAFFDYDNDGDLDMYLLNHSIHSEMTYGNSKIRFQRDLKSGDKLFRHDIVDGKSFFTDVSESSGILGSNIGYGLGVSVSDINKDGCDDIYISNDFRENDYLYINNCDGTFSESLEDYIRHTSRFSMGNDIGDVNNDGLLDILVLDMLPSDEFVLKSSAGEDSYEIYKMKLDFGYNKQFTRNTLQLNLGNDNFAEIAQLSGIHATDWSWSTLIEDFDLDGLNDIFITNGILKRPNDMDYINFISNNQISGNLDNKTKLTNLELIDQMPDGKVSNYLFRNNSNLNFTDESENWGLDFEGYSNGATYSDLDNDGDLDLILNNINSKAKIYSNQSNEFYPERNFISINFIGDKLNKNGIGSKVTIWTDNKILYKENFANKGFLSSTSPGLVFGLNNYEIIDSMLVQWPSGKAQKLYSIKGNKILNLYEKEARLKNNITYMDFRLNTIKTISLNLKLYPDLVAEDPWGLLYIYSQTFGAIFLLDNLSLNIIPFVDLNKERFLSNCISDMETDKDGNLAILGCDGSFFKFSKNGLKTLSYNSILENSKFLVSINNDWLIMNNNGVGKIPMSIISIPVSINPAIRLFLSNGPVNLPSMHIIIFFSFDSF